MTPDEANVKGQELANEIAPLLADLSIVGKHIAKALLQAVEAERKARDRHMAAIAMALEDAAAAIRARGKNND